MSTLGGIFNFECEPVSEQTLIHLGRAFTQHAPEGGGHESMDSVGMTYRAFHTSLESRLEVQPLTTAEGYLLCWDGRLDNREELLASLRNEKSSVQTDVAIVMACYKKWGLSFLPKLIGDFALSLYDSRHRTLILARDPIGNRTLLYHVGKQKVIWSSELKPLLSLSELDHQIDEEYVAQFLVRSPAPDRSPYKGIKPVPPGYAVIIRESNVEVKRFWSLDPTQEIHYRNDAEYEEHYRHLFHEAVECRLRVNGPVWAELSGGLDSSSIVCMANQILETGHVQATRLETVSYISDECHSADERVFIRHVEERIGNTSRYLKHESYPLFASFDGECDVVMPNLLHCFANRYKALQEIMAETGARVLLSGQGGDEVNCSQEDVSPALGDLLTQGRLIALHKEIQRWSEIYKRPYLELLWNDAVQPRLPRQIQARLKQKPQHRVPSWLAPAFVARLNVRERMLGTTDVYGFRLPSSRDQSAGFLSAVSSICAGSFRERCQIEITHPYLHRPLVEFLQAIPYEQRVRPGEARSVMRRALRDLLPEKIARRRSKGGIDEVLYRTLSREWPRLHSIFENARVCSHGYVDSQSLLAALNRARLGCEPYTGVLFRTIALEFWLRALEVEESKIRSAA